MNKDCPCGNSEAFHTIAKAANLREEIDHILEKLRVPIQKADPLNPFRQKDFLRLEARIVRRLREAFSKEAAEELKELRALIKSLDPKDAKSVESFFRKSGTILKGLDREVAKRVTPVLEAGLEETFMLSKASQIKTIIRIGGEKAEAAKEIDADRSKKTDMFGGKDQKVIDLLNRNQEFYLKASYKGRIEDFDVKARSYLSDALETNLSRKSVAKGLRGVMGSTIDDPNYWNVYGAAWVNKSRNWAALDTMNDVGFETFIIIATMDQRTSAICRAMNGKRFSVAKALETMEQSAKAKSLDELKETTPWMTTRKGKDGEELVGLKDRKTGSFTALFSNSENVNSLKAIQDLGVSLPPYHGLCRTTVGVVDED